MDLFDLSGKVAIVTGGSRGLGREMVMAFAEHGADVVIASRKLENCASVADEVRALGRRALPIAYHAASWDGAGTVADAAHAEFGRVDVLVNNAGMSPLYPSVDAISEDLYDKVMGRQPEGAVPAVGDRRHAMAARTVGSIVLRVVVASQRPSPNELVYGAAKAASTTSPMARSRAPRPKVRVNCIVPGAVPDRHLEGLGPRSVQPRGEHAVRARPAAASRTRSSVPALYFASDASSYTPARR
jgi:NAD(P)-dependent dehydrogenase (short-subunit alcohol dehydrogenase family)